MFSPLQVLGRGADATGVLIDTSPEFLFWGTVYVVLKWTIGLWAFRRLVSWVRSRG